MILRSTIIGSGVAISATLLSTNCNAFTPQYRTTSITTTQLTKLYQQQPQQQFYDANGNPINTPPMVYDANGNLVPFAAPPQQMQPPQMQAPMQPGGQAQIQFEPNVPNALEPPLPSKSKNTDSPRPVGKFLCI